MKRIFFLLLTLCVLLSALSLSSYAAGIQMTLLTLEEEYDSDTLVRYTTHQYNTRGEEVETACWELAGNNIYTKDYTYQYSYDNDGNRTKISYSSKSESWSESITTETLSDYSWRTTSVRSPGGDTTVEEEIYSTDWNLLRSSITYNGQPLYQSEFTYDSDGLEQTAKYISWDNPAHKPQITTVLYLYDDYGNPIEIENGNLEEVFVQRNYDQGRLANMSVAFKNYQEERSYRYGSLFERTLQDDETTLKYRYQNNGLLESIYRTDGQNISNNTFQYDQNGNIAIEIYTDNNGTQHKTVYTYETLTIPVEPTFQDVSASAYYFDAVEWAVDCGITQGTSATTFSPSNECTRAQVVTFLWRAMGCPDPTSKNSPFKDVQDQSTYYYNAVLWAVENGITQGTDINHFSPNATCTRAQVVTFLWRTEGQPSMRGRKVFQDVSENTYYFDAVIWALEKNVTTGTDDTHFSPNQTCTRAQIVTFLYRDLA